MDFELVIKWWERAKFVDVGAREAIEINKATITLGRMIEQCRKDSTPTEVMSSKVPVPQESFQQAQQPKKSKQGQQDSQGVNLSSSTTTGTKEHSPARRHR